MPEPYTSFQITLLCPASGCSNTDGQFISKVFWVEIIMTFFFVLIVLTIVKHHGSQDMPINAFAIGISLYTAISVAGPISGGCINPAVGTIQYGF